MLKYLLLLLIIPLMLIPTAFGQITNESIVVETDKASYSNGETIIITGNINNYNSFEDIKLTYIVKSPTNNLVTIGQLVPNSDGTFTFSFKAAGNNFKVNGDYIIEIKYGGNTSELVINYVGGDQVNIIVEEGKEIQEGMVISVTESKRLDGINDFLNIHILGAAQTVKIEIITSDGTVIETLSSVATGGGEINQPWKIPKDFAPGTYTITATDSLSNFTQTTFEYEGSAVIIPEPHPLILQGKQIHEISHQLNVFENRLSNLQSTIEYQQIKLDEVTLNNATQRMDRLTAKIESMTALQNIYELLINLTQNQMKLHS